jgi:hypothetical protein
MTILARRALLRCRTILPCAIFCREQLVPASTRSKLSRSHRPLSTRIVFLHSPQPETKPSTIEMIALVKSPKRNCSMGSMATQVLRETVVKHEDGGRRDASRVMGINQGRAQRHLCGRRPALQDDGHSKCRPSTHLRVGRSNATSAFCLLPTFTLGDLVMQDRRVVAAVALRRAIL